MRPRHNAKRAWKPLRENLILLPHATCLAWSISVHCQFTSSVPSPRVADHSVEKSAPKPAAPTDTNLPLPTAATKRQDDLQPLLDTLIACLTPMSISHPKLYPTFIEQLAHPLFEPLEAAELRKISSSLNAMISEKQKREREQNAKGKGAKGIDSFALVVMS